MIIFCSKPICHVGVRKKGHCTIMHFLGLIARAGWEIRENVEGRVVGVSLPALVTALLHNRRIARRHRKPLWGSFTNYVDQILTFSDHLPTYCGLSWTFGALPTPCPRGQRKP